MVLRMPGPSPLHRENLLRHHKPIGKKFPKRDPPGPVVPQTVHDRVLLFNKLPRQKLLPLCPMLVPNAAGKRTHERNHLHHFLQPNPK